jgi:periplasmic protein TonB
MLDVLLESRAARTRHIGGTVTSAVVHGTLVAAAIALTVPVTTTRPSIPAEGILPYVPARPMEPVAPTPAPAQPSVQRPDAIPRAPTIQFADPKAPVVDLTPSVAPTSGATVIGPSLPTGGISSTPIGMSGPPGGIVDEHMVDRAPRMIGRAEPPVFPSALRAIGKSGRVVVQFVVDTTGRAEMSEFRSIESSDPLFVEAVRAALPRYRFSPGEADGRKVRTLVQLPFDFTLVR